MRYGIKINIFFSEVDWVEPTAIELPGFTGFVFINQSAEL